MDDAARLDPAAHTGATLRAEALSKDLEAP